MNTPKTKIFKFRGRKLVYRKGFDLNILKQVCSKREYDEICPGIFDRTYRNLVDVGANIGAVSVGYADCFDRIYSFEPSRDNFSLLSQSRELNSLEDKMDIFNFGINSCDDELKLYAFMSDHTKKVDTEWNFGAKMIYFDPEIHDPEHYELIQLKAYSWFEENLPAEIDMLKVDCEGAEEFLFYNSDRTELSSLMNDRVHHFVAEVHPGINPHIDTPTLLRLLETRFELNYPQDPAELTHIFPLYGRRK